MITSERDRLAGEWQTGSRRRSGNTDTTRARSRGRAWRRPRTFDTALFARCSPRCSGKRAGSTSAGKHALPLISEKRRGLDGQRALSRLGTCWPAGGDGDTTVVTLDVHERTAPASQANSAPWARGGVLGRLPTADATARRAHSIRHWPDLPARDPAFCGSSASVSAPARGGRLLGGSRRRRRHPAFFAHVGGLCFECGDRADLRPPDRHYGRPVSSGVLQRGSRFAAGRGRSRRARALPARPGRGMSARDTSFHRRMRDNGRHHIEPTRRPNAGPQLWHPRISDGHDASARLDEINEARGSGIRRCWDERGRSRSQHASATATEIIKRDRRRRSALARAA